MSDAMSMLVFLDALTGAHTPEEWGQVVKRNATVALSPATLEVLRMSSRDARKKGDERLALSMEMRVRFLTMVREKGIDAAVVQERRHQDELEGAIIALLSTSAIGVPDLCEEHQNLLLTEEGISIARYMAQQLDKADAAQRKPAWEAAMYKRGRELRIEFLVDARAHGLNAATQHYAIAVRTLMEQSAKRAREETDPNLE